MTRQYMPDQTSVLLSTCKLLAHKLASNVKAMEMMNEVVAHTEMNVSDDSDVYQAKSHR